MEMKMKWRSILVVMAVLLIATGPASILWAETNSALKQIDDTYAQIAQKVTPTVVNISSTGKDFRFSQHEEQNPSLKQFPFREHFGDDFYKHFREAPEEKSGPAHVAMGSGVIVSPEGTILTNAHVVKNMDQITVTLTDKRTFKAKVVGIDPESDVAVIKIEAKNLPTATLGNSDKLRVGEPVLAVGNPFGLSGTVTSGIVSAKGRSGVGIIGYENFIQTDAAINPGNSGGPLVNMNGEVIGLNTAIASRSGGYQGVGFAIPSNSVQLVMDQLVKEGKVHRGLLGINIQDMNEALAKSFGRKDLSGALVSQVVPGSPAEKAGIKSGDIVLSFNGQAISGAAELKNLVGNQKPGDSAKLTIWRKNQTQNITVAVGERTEKTLASAAPQEGNSADLGLRLEKVPAGVAKRLGLKDGAGLMIKSVDPNGAGSRMGLAENDVILDVDGKKVTNVESFNNEVEAAKANHVIRLMVQRGSSTIYLGETIG